MAIKEQWKKIKENWLLLVIVLVILIFVSSGSKLMQVGTRDFYGISNAAAPMADASYDESYAAAKGGSSYSSTGGFAPEVENRVITKTASLSTEVEQGRFHDAESTFKSIIQSSGSYLLNENVNNYGTKLKSYYSGSYQIKVDASKYDAVISQLKGIGEVTSFNENQKDITKEYVNIQIEIDTEKARLARYEAMYAQADKVSDKIELNDRIFNQERTIKYMEDSLKNMDQRVDYSTIYFSMKEKQSEYAYVAFVKFSELVNSLVNSFNTLVSLIVVLLPWAIAALVIFFVVRLFRKKR